MRLSCRALDSQTDENRLGLGNARSPSIQRSHLSQAAYIDVVYDVTWPLSIVISPNDLKRYRQCFPVLLQARSRCPCLCFCVLASLSQPCGMRAVLLCVCRGVHIVTAI